jgi:sugar fermentation stimulation protein A
VNTAEPSRSGILLQRYKRFQADIRLGDNSVLTVHCPNSGSMKGCSTPGSAVVVSRSGNSRRKYPWTLEMVRAENVWVGVNTSLTNKLVREALEKRVINDFGPIDSIRGEVRVSAASRLDFLIRAGGRNIYLEVKNCSLAENGVALFPDAVTARGVRHLLELDRLRRSGHQAALIFCVQRADVLRFMPAAAIDPVYAETLRAVYENGLTVLAYRAEVQPGRIDITEQIPVFDNG